MEYVIGVDLGGTQLRAVLVDRSGNVYAQESMLTEAVNGPQHVIDRAVMSIERVRACIPDDGVLLGVGVGSPGPVDPETGIVFTTPNMPGWHYVPLRDMLAERIGLRIELGNDANAAALGEWHFGKGVGCQHLVYVTISTGIGGGVIVDNRLLLGRIGAGGEIGHMLIDAERFQTWENMASGTALGAAAAAALVNNLDTILHTLATPETVTAAHVSQAAARDDRLAQALMQREAELLGVGFVSLLHLFSPQKIIVGGSVVTRNPGLIDAARHTVRKYVISDVYNEVPIEVSALGDRVGLLGAAALFLYNHE